MVNVPRRIDKLPRWRIMGQDYPVPHFVTWIGEDGKPTKGNTGTPDFRVMNMDRWLRCWKAGLCWVCGEKLGVYKAYVIGPMCAVTRTTSEPGSHLECAVYSAQACPFLSNPKMKRGSEVKELPANSQEPVGFFISRNPGVACIWVTKSATRFKAHNGTLITLGDPEAVHWFAHGRAATCEEVMASIESGYPALLSVAEMEGDGAVEELMARRNAMMKLLPVGAEP
jgi:hypothetical protein